MGIYCNVWQVVSETIDDIRSDPTIAREVIDELEEYNDELPEEDKILFDVDKNWDIISFFLSRHPDLKLYSQFLKEGGEDVPGTDMGFGLAREFNAALTGKIYNAFSKISSQQLTENTTLEQMLQMEVYLALAGDDITEFIDTFHGLWPSLIEFLHSAYKKGRGLLIYLY